MAHSQAYLYDSQQMQVILVDIVERAFASEVSLPGPLSHRTEREIRETFDYAIRHSMDEYFWKLSTSVRVSFPEVAISSKTVTYPRDWWQAVRQRFLPGWWVKRHPILWHTEQVECRVDMSRVWSELWER